MRKLVTAFIALVVLSAATTAMAAPIVMDGSTTVLPFGQAAVEQFMKENAGVKFSVSGTGTGNGFKSLADGSAQIANASRFIKDSEIKSCMDKNVYPVPFAVALDCIVPIVHKDNPVKGLSHAQLKDIYSGKVTNWNQVGGADVSILPYGRQTTSGTYEFFFETVMKKEDFATGVSQETGNAAIATKVNQNAGGIGYIGIGYAQQAQGVKTLSLKADVSSEAFLPTDEEAVYAGDYPLSRHLYVYTNGTPEGAVKKWVEYILSDEGQAVVEEAGFYKLDADTLSAMKAQL